jgi:hypothetical protein
MKDLRQASSRVKVLLDNVMRDLAFLTDYPIRLVEESDLARGSYRSERALSRLVHGCLRNLK